MWNLFEWLLGRTERGKTKSKRRSRGFSPRNGWIEVPDDRVAWRRVQTPCMCGTDIFAKNIGVGGWGIDIFILFFSFCCFSSPIESKPPIVIPLVLKLEKERCKSFDHQENRKSITTLRHVRASWYAVAWSSRSLVNMLEVCFYQFLDSAHTWLPFLSFRVCAFSIS